MTANTTTTEAGLRLGRARGGPVAPTNLKSLKFSLALRGRGRVLPRSGGDAAAKGPVVTHDLNEASRSEPTTQRRTKRKFSPALRADGQESMAARGPTKARSPGSIRGAGQRWEQLGRSTRTDANVSEPTTKHKFTPALRADPDGHCG